MWRSPKTRQLEFTGRSEFQSCAAELRYAHILSPTSLSESDRSALFLGFALAGLHESKLTVLHVLPPDPFECSPCGLDAVSLLHAAANELHSPSAGPSPDAKRFAVREYVEGIVPQRLQDGVSARVECRRGKVAETIAGFANENGVDLVILSARLPPWWLPVLPATVRTVEQRARGNVIVIRDRAGKRPGAREGRSLLWP